MTNPETSADAVGDLDAAVYHQGGAVYPAGAAAVPFLIRFALDPAVPHRADVLDLVCRFARLGREMKEPWRSRPSARICRTALLAAFDSLLQLLDEADSAIRRGGVAVLGELVERADDLADDLMRRVPGEKDPDVAADYVLALSTTAVNGILTPEKRAGTATWLSERIPPAGDSQRLTYLVAARRLGHQAGTAGHLLAAYPDSVPKRTVGWLGRELGADREGRIALARTGIGEAARTQDDRPLAEVGTVMGKWRSATVALTPDVGAALDRPPAIRTAAVHLLAASGDVGRIWSNRVAELISRPGRTGALAAWALARWGDRRAVPVIERSLRQDPEVFAMGSTHYSDGFYWLSQDPASPTSACRWPRTRTNSSPRSDGDYATIPTPHDLSAHTSAEGVRVGSPRGGTGTDCHARYGTARTRLRCPRHARTCGRNSADQTDADGHRQRTRRLRRLLDAVPDNRRPATVPDPRRPG